MQSAEDLAIAITGIDPDAYFPGCAKQIQVREILATYAAMIAARDAEWQARVDTLLEDNARSEEQVKKQFANAVSFKARAEKAEARVDRLEAALKYARLTAGGILAANYKAWDEGLNTPEGYIQWSKSRAGHLLLKLDTALAESEAANE